MEGGRWGQGRKGTSNTEATVNTHHGGGWGGGNQNKARPRALGSQVPQQLGESLPSSWSSGRWGAGRGRAGVGLGQGLCRQGYTYHSFLEMKDPSF